MHTVAYIRVVEKMQRRGREYGEGFTSDDFAGLTESERQEVYGGLLDRARRRDGVALDGIRSLVSEDKFASVVWDLLTSEAEGSLFRAQLLTTLCKVRKDGEFWRSLVHCLTAGGVPTKRWILNQMQSLAVPPEIQPLFRSALQEFIREGAESSTLFMAATVALALANIQPRTAQYIDLVKRLQSSTKSIRNAAVEELTEYQSA